MQNQSTSELWARQCLRFETIAREYQTKYEALQLENGRLLISNQGGSAISSTQMVLHQDVVKAERKTKALLILAHQTSRMESKYLSRIDQLENEVKTLTAELRNLNARDVVSDIEEIRIERSLTVFEPGGGISAPARLELANMEGSYTNTLAELSEARQKILALQDQIRQLQDMKPIVKIEKKEEDVHVQIKREYWEGSPMPPVPSDALGEGSSHLAEVKESRAVASVIPNNRRKQLEFLEPPSTVMGGLGQGFHRKVISRLLGGNTQGCINRDYYAFRQDNNIWLPSERGHHGYVFLGLPGNGSDSEIGKTPKKTNLFIGHGTNEWNYMGVYEFLLVEGREWMSKEEWRNLPNKFKNQYSTMACVRYHIEPKQMRAAFDSGKEQVPVRQVRALGYNATVYNDLLEKSKMMGYDNKSRLVKRKAPASVEVTSDSEDDRDAVKEVQGAAFASSDEEDEPTHFGSKRKKFPSKKRRVE